MTEMHFGASLSLNGADWFIREDADGSGEGA